MPPEDVLDSTSLTPLSAGLAGSDPLPVSAAGRASHETKGEDASVVINGRGSGFTVKHEARVSPINSPPPSPDDLISLRSRKARGARVEMERRFIFEGESGDERVDRVKLSFIFRS